MAKQLTIDEMLEAAQDSNMPGTDDFVRAFEGMACLLSQSLSAHLGVVSGEATFQPGFGGTCAAFYAKEPGQECPEPLQHLDEGGEWDTKAEHTESVLSAIGPFNEPEYNPQTTAAKYGCYIGHDINGWYVADEREREHDEAGPSVGFDGRPHFATADAAVVALIDAEKPADLLKAE